ncbi:hypothetical protein K6119_19345 [Paracrocinitomix mangrovi]|uniref:hypothetical protein n=1 Tax=Paracrocinitomix mangrovi TaxID=2862509 RepID=UPI001C8D2F01|nr:hypothetical protein [Paracrocinitomix mangrovi]UKN01882.1 hypothetical protein K6119_19345 [Paracrocinitomix mangrovi]
MTSFHSTYILALIAIVLSCSGSEDSDINKEVIRDGMDEGNELIDSTDLRDFEEDANEAFDVIDTLESMSGILETPVKLGGKLLNSSTYHEDELDSSWFDQDWYLLYRDSDKVCYLEKVDILYSRVNDPILDGDEGATGWKIETDFTDPHEEIILMSNVGELEEGEVIEINLMDDVVAPAEQEDIVHMGQEFFLRGYGKSKKVSEEFMILQDYYLIYGAVTSEGKKTRQLITHFEFFDDAMLQILFVGDIDQDGIPDLMIDNRNKYNSFVPTLFLSGSAKSPYLLNQVATVSSVGC